MVPGFDMNCNKMSAFSALHLLRSYNHLFLPDGFGYGAAVLPALVQCANPALSIGACRRERTRDTPTTLLTTPGWTEDRHRIFSNVSPTSEHQPFGFRPPLGDERSPETPEDTFLPYEARRLLDPRGHAFGSEEAESRLGGGGATHSQCGGLGGRTMRPRGEKRPIPEEQKDERYFERRKRNNQAAKKSRDARKIREDQIALRATMLEHENAMLRSQLLTLREEATSLRQMLLLSTKTTISRDQIPVLSTTAPSGGQIQTIPT